MQVAGLTVQPRSVTPAQPDPAGQQECPGTLDVWGQAALDDQLIEAAARPAGRAQAVRFPRDEPAAAGTSESAIRVSRIWPAMPSLSRRRTRRRSATDP